MIKGVIKLTPLFIWMLLMKFVEYQDTTRNRIRHYEADKILVNAHWYNLPCAIAPQIIINDLQLSTDKIQFEDMKSLQDRYTADLIIIGSKSEPKWDVDWLKLQAQMHQLGIGVEQMYHDAAIRTFNVLTTEDRPVWLVLL